MPQPVILIHVEDPGAANMVLGLAAALDGLGLKARLVAGNAAAAYLRGRGEAPEGLPAKRDPAALLDATAPAALLIGTSEDPDTPAFALAAEAKRRGLPTVCLVDGPANADRRLRGRGDGPLTHLTDWLLTADAGTRDAFRDLGADAGRIRVVGNPVFDRVRDAGDALAARSRADLRREVFPGLPADAPLILFLTELSDGLDPAQFRRRPDYTLHGRGGADGRTEIVLEEVLDAAARAAPGVRVVLRLHPKTPERLYAAYADETAAVSTGGDPHPAIAAADLVIGLSTALLSEAAVMGRPVLSVLPRQCEGEWLVGAWAAEIARVTTRDALDDALARALAAPAAFVPAGAAAGRWSNAAHRIARAVAAIALGKAPAPDGTPPYAPPVLETARLLLEPFPEDLLTERYVAWLNDPEVVRYSEQRHRVHTLDTCREFVAGFPGTPNALWAIREKAHGLRHIGNISTEVDPASGVGDIRILIGEREAWGTGLGAEAWLRVMAHLFDDLGMARVTAGTLEDNTGMRRIMEKAGMLETRRSPGPTPVDGRVMDLVFAERTARDWRRAR